MSSETVLCSFPLLQTTQDGLKQLMLDRLSRSEGAWVLTLNLEMVARSRRDPAYSELAHSADIFVADGMPLIWASRLKRGSVPLPERCTGSDLTVALIKELDLANVAILGGVSPRAALQKLRGEEALKAFIFDGKVLLDEASVREYARQIQDHGAKMVFLALGVPKQDQLAALLRPMLPDRVLIGVGGSFEMIEGAVKRAPVWMQRIGFEWLYRLLGDPKRLWRRYLVEYWGGGIALLIDILRGTPRA